LFIATSVVSARHKSHVTVDCGLKGASTDVPPRIVAGAPLASRWRPLGDEHGAIVHPAATARDVDTNDADPAVPWPDDAPREGDIVWLQPGHCDPTINLYDAFYATREDGGLDCWPIDARRTTPVKSLIG
jgi:D-serine deaminase-like pyridoxal phosphate-dependent protein